jgi:hypothetical protein
VIRGCLVLSVLATSHAHGAPNVTTGKARIELGVRKPKHFLGENVQLDFCVVNSGAAAIEIQVGGDYRGGSRSQRFAVEVRDGKGALVPDPDPTAFNMGGLGYTPKLEPGKRWCQSLPLARYARIRAPGTYTITATHDLGWPAQSAPRGKATIKLAMPTAAQAEQVIAAMEKLPDDPSTSAGSVSVEYADFTALAHEPYVVPLEARAKQGVVKAIAGLTHIPTATATHALVGLLGHADPAIARASAQGLAMRLPDPALAGQLGARHPFENAYTEQRKYLSNAWVPALADDVRAAARTRLASPQVSDQQDGAFMLEAVGTTADAPALTKALEVAIDRTRTVPAETTVYPVPRGAVMELLRATEMLVARGLSPPVAPKSHGELAVWLVAIHKGARPTGWETTLARAMQHSTAYVRQLAMERSPEALSPPLASAVAANLAHADPDVQVAAAQLAERAKLLALAPDVVKAMRRATGLRLNIISNAAYMLGARHDRAQMLVVRLADKDAFEQALAELCDLLDYNGRSTNGTTTDAMRAAVVTQWKKFVADHRADIEASKKIPLTDPSVTKELLPPTWKLGKRTGGQWP